jgi:DNA polymerase-4
MSMDERAIIHLNVADFAVAVERLVDRRLRQRPVIVAPGGSARAVVYDMSDEAYQAGVRKGMPLQRARRRCAEARVLPLHHSRYEQAMRVLVRQARPYSPLIEPGVMDGHLFVDVTGTQRLFGPPVDVAWRLGRRIRAELGIDPIWSVAPNKLVAKVATRLVKPAGEYIIGAGEEATVLAPLPLEVLPGLESPDLRRLREFSLSRIGDVAALSRQQLEVICGTRAEYLFEAARGIDPSPVLPVNCGPPAVAAEHELAEDTNDRVVVEAVAYRLVEQVAAELRRRRRAAGCLRVVLDFSDGIRCARRTRVAPASANDGLLFEAARQALTKACLRRVRVRHLRLLCEQVVFPSPQLPLFSAERRASARRARLAATVDAIRTRFGPGVVATGRCLAA